MRTIVHAVAVVLALLLSAHPAVVSALEESDRIRELETRLAAVTADREQLRQEVAILRLELKTLQRQLSELNPSGRAAPGGETPTENNSGKGWVVKVVRIVRPDVQALSMQLTREKKRLSDAEARLLGISDRDKTVLRETVARLEREYADTLSQFRTLYAQTEDGQNVKINAFGAAMIALADKAREGNTYRVQGSASTIASGLQIRMSNLTELTPEAVQQRSADLQLAADSGTARSFNDLLATIPPERLPAADKGWNGETPAAVEQWLNGKAVGHPMEMRLAFANSTPRMDGKITASFNECTVELGRFTYRLNVQVVISSDALSRAGQLTRGAPVTMKGKVAHVAISPTANGAMFDLILSDGSF